MTRLPYQATQDVLEEQMRVPRGSEDTPTCGDRQLVELLGSWVYPNLPISKVGRRMINQWDFEGIHDKPIH